MERALEGSADAAQVGRRTGSGLREDQAAAALSVLADGRRASVINAPAGSGKTRVLAEVGSAWQEAGLGPVVGITAAQSARNTLAAGIAESYNSAQFLGHLPGRRGARGHVPVAPGTLLVIDEGSMMSSLDLADLITLAGAQLMTADHALRRELSRRIRDDLIRLGYVNHGRGVRIADGGTASGGDLIIATRNDHAVEAGEPGRTLANGDLLRIDAVTDSGLLVRRALDADRATGLRRWTDQQFLYANFDDAELGYAVTDHVAQGRTVTAGLAVIAGTEDRQHAYVALTRGTDDNTAYVFTQSPKRADPAPGPRSAPELARYDRLAAQADTPALTTSDTAGTEEALRVLAEVLGRDGEQVSASQTWQQALADADHLALLHAIWTAETTPARDQRYRELLTASLPPGHGYEPGHREKWLWRTLHAAELAGLDARQLLAGAVSERDLAGARDIAAVIDARIRRRTAALAPVAIHPWSGQLPGIAQPERRAYVRRVAALMDSRKERIGQHAAAHALSWAVSALGAVPAYPAGRLEWQRRAAAIGAYRELSGYSHPADPIGPEPASSAPELRAAWHEALAALGPVDGPDVRGMADGLLMRLRDDTYPLETAWAPPWTGDALRQARAAARDARLGALRAAAEADFARRRGENDQAGRQEELAASYHALHDAYRERETVLATTMADRVDWEHATRAQRQLAVSADAELRRRHPGERWPPLRSAEPMPLQAITDPQSREEALELGESVDDLAARHHEFAARLAERNSVMIPAEDPDYEDLSPAFPAWTNPGHDAILQPPKPQIQPCQQVTELVARHDPDMEAAS
jgi:hypothetical protein